ncbi:MAG: GreA/GreB family elongation factor [Bdellovibrionota bacterium]
MSELKAEVVARIIERLEAELQTLLSAARAAHEAATHEESKPEDQYDTRGLEASYLAHAQSLRAEEIQRAIAYFKSSHELQLLTVESDGRQSTYLVARAGGGISVNAGGKSVSVITPDSPLGSELTGRKAGDEFEVELRGSSRSYRVVE